MSVCHFWEWRASEKTEAGEETGIGKEYTHFPAACEVCSLAPVPHLIQQRCGREVNVRNQDMKGGVFKSSLTSNFVHQQEHGEIWQHPLL